MLDDIGFGQAGRFGGLIPTPNIDKLAARGVTYNNFHTTGISSPTRAALLTGRNHHQVGFGTISELSTGFPGYNSVWPKSVASIAEVLKDNGYSTSAFGKWHNTPDWETSPAGPFQQWPTGLGFQHFYGFQGGKPVNGNLNFSTIQRQLNQTKNQKMVISSTKIWSIMQLSG